MATQAPSRTSLDVEHLCDFSIDFDPTQVIPTGAGTRVIYVVKNGTVRGERLNGEFVAGGGDWITLGTDQIVRLDVRATIRTDDGELVYVTNTGRVDLRGEMMERLMNGDRLTSSDMYARSAPLFETGAEDYAWLNSAVTVAFNGLAPSHVDYEIFRIL